MPRLFTGIQIPDETRRFLSMLRGGLAGARWADPQNYHMTLRFIGDVDMRTANEVVHQLSAISRFGFDLRMSGVGVFGGNKPHTIWAGVAPSPALMELQAEQERLLQRMGLRAEGRKFQPHVTIARLRHVAVHDVARYLDLYGDFRAPEFSVESFALFSAREFEGGGPYIAEETFPLAGFEYAHESDYGWQTN
ncbi:MAG: RNA 2',3'-cyclic phosphodiesterase [Rhodobiaceae bacterium]|nr:RNA 2',3'-cyclic phosphodiesterase [Rhodobiaceae bacterium]MCC0055523.1 RNA 2',3'-cyclic phosphodiesterase [Rhodobiaceae bacterium]